MSDRLSAAIKEIMEQPQGEVSEVNFILSSPRREESEANSNVNHPHHYNRGGIECIEAMLSAFGRASVREFCVINAFKYIWRYKEKGHENEDLEKAKWYIDYAISLDRNSD